MAGQFRVRAFAELAGVTVRALHHYDRLALLRPKRTRSGYRTYAPEDLERLEQIVALKFLGLPLKQVKTVLDRDRRALPDVLRAQRRALEEKRQRLDQAIGVIAHAERSIELGKPADATLMRHIIEVIEMQNDGTEMKKYYNDEAWAELERRRREMTAEQQAAAEAGTRKWQALFTDVEAALDADPAGPAAQALVDRWMALVDEFTHGHAEIASGVARAWNDRGNWSPQMQQRAEPFSDKRIWDFIRKASDCRGRRPEGP